MCVCGGGGSCTGHRICVEVEDDFRESVFSFQCGDQELSSGGEAAEAAESVLFSESWL